MFKILGATRRLCDGLGRREFLCAGALGTLCLPNLPSTSSPPGTPAAGFGRAKRCMLVFLTGGPPQHDTFDLKPDAPAEIRGELRPIATNVPGIHVGELCPRLARVADRYCIVRSVTHADSTHTSAGYTMLTGVVHPHANAPGASLVRPNANDHPHLGSVLARMRPPRDGTPAFASLPEVIKDAAVNEFPGQGAGFFGQRYDPFRIEAEPDRSAFSPPDIVLPAGVTAARLEDRRLLLSQLDRSRRVVDEARSAGRDIFRERAFDLIGSPAVRRALELGRETDRRRAAYGMHLFGQGCLLGRRLLEAGVPLVTVYWHYEGPDDSPVWDTHENNFAHLRERLMPPADQAVAALIDDLDGRGMLADTLVICMGEFGRTPRINRKGGRDHWPHVQSILLAGAGIRGGSVHGASDRIGAYPAAAPVSPADLTATFLHLLGIAPETIVHDRTGRPLVLCHGTPVGPLLGA